MSALGTGDVYVSEGHLVATTSLTVKGNYTQLVSTELDLSVSSAQTVGLQIGGTATIVGGTLRVTVPKNWNGDGQTITVLRAQTLQGFFSAVQVDGYKATPAYVGGELQLQLSR